MYFQGFGIYNKLLSINRNTHKDYFIILPKEKILIQIFSHKYVYLYFV